MTNTSVINQSNNQELVTTDFDRFDTFLDSLGLPKDNILATTDERNIVQTNFPSFVNSLPDNIKRESRYLSKFAAASAIGLFDAALNYIWNEVVINLRKKAIVYGLDLFFDSAVGGKHRDLFNSENDLSGLKDKVLLDTCSKLELISDIIYKKLTHILIMRNDIGASHPNDSNVNAYELMGYLQICVQDVINDKPSEAAIQIKAFVENLKKQQGVIDQQTLQHMQNGIKQLHTRNNDNVLRTMFGMYSSAGGNNILKKNISIISPTIWAHSSEELKYKLGITLDGYRANLHSEKYEAGNEFFEFCNGNEYKTLEARIIILSELLDELKIAHEGWDNFHHEVPVARKIKSHINVETDIPPEIQNKLIHLLVTCRIGRGISYCSGVSPIGKTVYDTIFSKFGDTNIVTVLVTLYSSDILYMLSNKYCNEHALTILNNLKENTINEKLLEILSHLLSSPHTLDKALKESNFKTLASSHIKFN